MIQLTREELDNLLRLKEKVIEKEIDAASCRTNPDWKAYHDAQQKFEEEYDKIVDLERQRKQRDKP